jgi:HEPN domain-containing protein
MILKGQFHYQENAKIPLPGLVCFHCQQAAEKYLKTLLIFHEVSFPKTHDLLLLLELAAKHHEELLFHRDLFEYLNPYSVQDR